MKTTHPKSNALPLALASILAAGVEYSVKCHADTGNANLAVTASIAAHCVISTTVETGAVTTTCTGDPAAAVTLDQQARFTANDSAAYQSTSDSQNQTEGAVVTTVMY